MSADRWICLVCWKPNAGRAQECFQCKTPRGIDKDQVEAQRKEFAARVEQRAAEPEAVPDLIVALPVVVFRSYARVWIRGGIGLLGFLALFIFAGIPDVTWLALIAGFAGGLIACGSLAREVAEAMRNREVWAFIVGAVLSVVAFVSSILAFDVFAPGLVDPNAVRVGSVVVFGGAGAAAIAGLVLMFRSSRRAA
jgi:hypothetical protein